MQDEYLPIGYKIGGHYEIIEVLGDDEFEIVYVVKDIHRLDTLFVLKELFIKEYSFRDDEKGVYILEKSKKSFEKTKKNVISEVNLFIEKGDKNSIRTYGYFEENNTIYTILEFINNKNLRDYLKITPTNSTKEIKPKVEIKQDKIKESVEEEEDKPKSYLYLKMLIASIVIFAILGVYAYNMIEEDKNRPREVTVASATQKTVKTVIPHPTLTDRTSKKEETEATGDIPKSRVTNSTRYIPPEDEGESSEPEQQEDKKIEIDSGVPLEEIIEVDQEEDNEPSIPIPTPTQTPKDNIEVVYVPPKRVSTNNVLLGDKVTNTDDMGPKFNRVNIKRFLEDFIASAEGNSIDRILSFYDTKVDRYFSLYGVTHKKIYRDKIRYNRKWVHRDFELLDFEILNISKINGIEYCDLRKRTKWTVSTSSGQTASGTSRVFMVLKRTPNGFKVKTIYSF